MRTLTLTHACGVAMIVAAGAGLFGCKGGEAQPPDEGDSGRDPAAEDETLPEVGPIERAATLLGQGRGEEALALIDAALLETPADHELHYARGVALQALGRGSEAIDAWRACLERQDGFFPALNGIGAVALDAGDFVVATDALERAIAAKPDFADAHYNLGLALLGSGEGARALVAFKAAERLAPGDPDVHLELVRLYLQRGEVATARVHADAAKRLAAGDPASARADAQVLMAEGRHAAAAVAWADLVAAAPDDAEARLMLSRALIRSDRASEALPHLESLAVSLPEEAVIFAEWGAALLAIGSLDGPEGALARLDRALELRGDLTSARLRRIAALAGLGRCREAKAAERDLAAAVPAVADQAANALGTCTAGKRR